MYKPDNIILVLPLHHICILQLSEGSSLMDIENVILAKVRDEEEDNSDQVFKSDKFQQDLFLWNEL